MNEARSVLRKLSIAALTITVKGNQSEFVQQQIEVMGVWQWLCLVTAWIVATAFDEIVAIRDLIAPPRRPIFLASHSRKRLVKKFPPVGLR